MKTAIPVKTAIPSNQLVRIAHIPGNLVGLLLSEMRTWLDHNGIQTLGFRTTTLGADDIAFDVEFRRAEQAALFRAAFVRHRPFSKLAPSAFPQF